MPEERNRIEVDRIACLLLCPDERSRDTLRSEAAAGQIEVVGDVMADACFRLAPLARDRSRALERFGVEPGRFLLATVHREATCAPIGSRASRKA
jgi:UDP-N-acetylglucosamine 2-epimerase